MRFNPAFPLAVPGVPRDVMTPEAPWTPPRVAGGAVVPAGNRALALVKPSDSAENAGASVLRFERGAGIRGAR